MLVSNALTGQVWLLHNFVGVHSNRRARELVVHSVMGVEAKRDKVVVDPDSSASDDDDTARLSPVRRRGSSASSDDDGAPSAAHAPLNRAVSDAEEDAFDRRDDEDEIAGTTVWYGCNMCYGFEPTLVEGDAWKHLLIGPSVPLRSP